MSNDVLGLRQFFTRSPTTGSTESQRPVAIACLVGNDSPKCKVIDSHSSPNRDAVNGGGVGGKKSKDDFHIHETLARLINAMASAKIGRDYICRNMFRSIFFDLSKKKYLHAKLFYFQVNSEVLWKF